VELGLRIQRTQLVQPLLKSNNLGPQLAARVKIHGLINES